MHARGTVVASAVVLLLGVVALQQPALVRAVTARPPPPSPFCNGEYADQPGVVGRETKAQAPLDDAGYTYCIRTTATYENVYYGKDGKLHKKYVRHVQHGTGFVYRAARGEWFVATNQHVAHPPAVTESDSDVEGVPAGSRKVRETIRIVANESDEEEGSQVTLTPVLADEALDLAVLKTRHELKVMPYKIGRSSALRVGNSVLVRGYPLGVFAAANTGRVIGTGHLDRERNWVHEDFIVDAPLNAGNSGSPVFAISCRTGEPELVGIYHAGYKNAQSLNVVVGVDQLLGPLGKLEPSRSQVRAPLDRPALLARLQTLHAPLIMPFGDRAVRVEADGGAVRFALLDADYPLTSTVELTLVVRGASAAQPSALVLPQRLGEREMTWVELGAGLRETSQRLHDALWKQLAVVLSVREAEGRRPSSAGSRAALAAAAAQVRARRAEQKEILQSIDFDADDLLRQAAAPSASVKGSESGR